MRTIPKILWLLAGLALLAGLGFRLLVARPFASAPPIPPPTRAHASLGTLADEVTPKGVLPRSSPFVIERIETPPLQDTENILLVGIDSRPERSGGRTDALVLVVLDRRSRHVGLVGIPRDLLVNIPGHDSVRINTVYLRGSRRGGSPEGTRLLKQVVRDVIGLPVAHVVFIKHAGFEQLIDSLEGIPVKVACPIRDRFLDHRGPGGRLTLDLTTGAHWLDGRTALMFARSRHGRGVKDRARRQQAVLLGLRDRLVTLGSARLAELIPALRRVVFTEMQTLELLRLARWVHRVRRHHIHGLVLGWKEARTARMPDGRWVAIPNPRAIHASLTRLFAARSPGHRSSSTPCPPADVGLTSSRRARPGKKNERLQMNRLGGSGRK